jgi:galactonate dehydratase
LAACLQVDLAAPNTLIQEQSLGIHCNAEDDPLDYLLDPAVFAFADGYVARPTGTGLGIEVHEHRRTACGRGRPRLALPDLAPTRGTLAEW